MCGNDGNCQYSQKIAEDLHLRTLPRFIIEERRQAQQEILSSACCPDASWKTPDYTPLARMEASSGEDVVSGQNSGLWLELDAA
jgi:hypothetical protein